MKLCKILGHKWHEDNFWRVRWSDGILKCSSHSAHILTFKCKRCGKEEIFVGENQVPMTFQIEQAKEKLKVSLR